MAAITTTDLARQIRRRSLQMIYEAGSGHPGGCLSCADILAVLYGSVLRPQPYVWGNDRDIFII